MARKQRDVRVVVLDGFVVAPPFHGDTVFRAGQFVLQAQEIFVGLQLRIIFDQREQTAQCSVELAVRGDFLLWRAGTEQRRTRAGDFAKDGLFLRGVAFHCLHQVGNQISAAL